MEMRSLPFLSELASKLSTTAIDDSVDILHCLLTASLYASAALFITLKKHAGAPIECWLSQTYTQQWNEFAEAFCLHTNTYWCPDASLYEVPENYRELYRIHYYQWTSMYFTMACALFVFPKFVWNYSQNFTNVSLPYFCEETSKIHHETCQRGWKVDEMVASLRDKLHAGAVYRRLRLIFMFIIVKMLYLFLAIGQFFFLAFFLGQRTDIFWGWKLFNNLLNGVTWTTTGMFPRTTFCEFKVREMAGNNREETIECEIGLNAFHEKIFLFLWFWLLFVIGVSCLGIIQSIKSVHGNAIVRSLLHTIHIEGDKKQKRCIEDFINNFLWYDGKLVIHFVKRQSPIVAEEFALKLYREYLDDNMTDEELEDTYSESALSDDTMENMD